jgi:hypothetical protein
LPDLGIDVEMTDEKKTRTSRAFSENEKEPD